LKRENLPIWRCLQQLLVQIELSVKGFSRYHKYSIGTELRQSALNCNRLLIRALNTPEQHRLRPVTTLQAQCDDLKLLIQVGKELGVYASFSQFQMLAEQAVSAGKQVGQWQRSLSKQVSEPKARAESI
jgi:hypothetical protein